MRVNVNGSRSIYATTPVRTINRARRRQAVPLVCRRQPACSGSPCG
ncbi:MAG: hypothetical protein VB140_03140 [Burkholderia sp.]